CALPIYRGRAEVAAPERRVDLLDVVVAEIRGPVSQLARMLGQRQLRLPELPVEHVLAELPRRLELLLADPVPDPLPRPGRLHEREPVAARPLARVGGDLYAGAVPELARERRDAAIDLCARAVVPDLGVHAEREVDRRGSLGERLHVTLGREHEDLALEQVHAEELHELLRLGGVLLPLEHLPEPRERLVGLALRFVRAAALLVAPVRRDAELRRAVHLVRAD